MNQNDTEPNVVDRSETEIARDHLEYLEENPGVCASLSVHVGRHPYVRWNGEAYEIAETSDIGRVEVVECDRDDLLNLFAENPVDMIPLSKAEISPPEPGRVSVWEYVDENGENVIRA